jgi:cell division transport system ATP-binding protein
MIRFDHISKQYRGTSRPALGDVSFEVQRGEFVFLVGASGSGKSSCLRLILKEEKPTKGKIHVLGQDLGTISSRKVPYFRRNLGVVFQDFRLLPNKTVYQNVAFTLQVIGKSRGFIQEAVPDVLKMVGLDGKAQRMPHELSGGEQQRVAIARAVVNKPQILLADEPTGNLDPATSAGIMAVLERINAGGTTVIMATHEASFVDQMKKRVIELSNGEIVRDERHGGYGVTAAIPVQRQQPRTEQPQTVQLPTGVVVPVAAAVEDDAVAQPTPPAAPPVQPAAPPAAQPAPQPAAGPAAAEAQQPDNVRPITRATPAVHPAEMSLAERLGLRANGTDGADYDDQNVGPVK